jgi:NitT/TauT family transport system permease protein
MELNAPKNQPAKNRPAQNKPAVPRPTAPCAPCAPCEPMMPLMGTPEAGMAAALRRITMAREFHLSLVVLVVFLAFWEWGPPLLGIREFIIPRLSNVVSEFFFMLANGRLLHHTWITTYSVMLGFFLGAILGMVMGYLLGMSPTTEIVTSPYILALQIAPKVAFAPLFIMWFGYNMTPKILVAVLIVFFPILINVLTAVRGVDPAMVNLARSFKASRWQIFWKIEFPASMPPLFSGLRIGATLAVIGITVGEFVGGNTGLGYLLIEGEGQANTKAVFVAIIMLTLIGIIAYCLVILTERWVLRYMPKRKFGEVGNQN